MGGGILPMAIFDDHIYFLFGKEYNSGEWSDFGGRREKGESPKQTAIREGVEELSGFLGSETQISNTLDKNIIKRIDTPNKTYTTFVFLTDFDRELPKYFNNNFRFMRKMQPELVKSSNGLFEKSEIKWVRQDKLGSMRLRYRQFFFNGIIPHLKKINI